MVSDKYGVPVTEDRWSLVGMEIQSFARKYPLHWMEFKKDLQDNRTEYQLAKEGDLKKAGWRNTASFPIVYRRKTMEEIMEDPHAEDNIIEVASLYTTLRVILPGLTEKDEKGSPNKLYKEFLRRFPIFIPGERI